MFEKRLAEAEKEADRSVKWPGVWSVIGIFTVVIGGSLTTVLGMHTAQPHAGAVTEKEFSRTLQSFRDQLDRIERRLP